MSSARGPEAPRGAREYGAVLTVGSGWRRTPCVCQCVYAKFSGRTPSSSRRPPWESPAATAQPAPGGPPVLGHLLEAQRQIRVLHEGPQG